MRTEHLHRSGHLVKARPEKLPRPTVWPFSLALGIVFLFWGIITGPVLVAVGFFLVIIALTGWINLLRYESRGQ